MDHVALMEKHLADITWQCPECMILQGGELGCSACGTFTNKNWLIDKINKAKEATRGDH